MDVHGSSHAAWPGGGDCMSFSAFFLFVMTGVYKRLLQCTLSFSLGEGMKAAMSLNWGNKQINSFFQKDEKDQA